MAEVKVLVGEVDGVEFCDPRERVLDAKDTLVDPAISGFDNVDDVLRSLSAGFGFKRVNGQVTIPTDQVMIVSCLEVTATGCLTISPGGCLRILG